MSAPATPMNCPAHRIGADRVKVYCRVQMKSTYGPATDGCPVRSGSRYHSVLV
jgi:hypothetical protein